MRKKIVFPISDLRVAMFREYTGSGALLVEVKNEVGIRAHVILSKEQKEALTEYLTGGFVAPTHYRLED